MPISPASRAHPDVLQIRWPSGHVDELKDLDVDRVVHVKERTGIVKVDVFKKH